MAKINKNFILNFCNLLFNPSDVRNTSHYRLLYRWEQKTATFRNISKHYKYCWKHYCTFMNSVHGECNVILIPLKEHIYTFCLHKLSLTKYYVFCGQEKRTSHDFWQNVRTWSVTNLICAANKIRVSRTGNQATDTDYQNWHVKWENGVKV